MKAARHPRLVTTLLLAASCASSWAAEYGTVISSTPVVAQVAAPQRQCTEEQWVYPPRSSGVGAAIGAIAGAAVGSQFGSGSGRAAATALGLVAGSVIGERAETDGTPATTRLVERCRTLMRMEQRVIGHDVVYEYQGVQRTARLAQEPGERIPLDVSPVGQVPPARWSGTAPAAAAPPVYSDEDEARPPPRVVYVQPDYRPVPAYAYGWPYTRIGLDVAIGGHPHYRPHYRSLHRHGWNDRHRWRGR